MIDRLTVANLKPGTKISPHGGEIFSISTCQRTLSIGLGLNPLKFIESESSIQKIYQGSDAYHFLLETILGLQSAVLAEHEVVNQFKENFHEYLKLQDKNCHIISILEKLFKDQKKIRTEHLFEIGQLSYAGIARKLIHNHANAHSVLVLGSGKLANDLINLLKKKYTVYVSGRNNESVDDLVLSHSVKKINWLDLKSYSVFPFIVNTIGSENIILHDSFFKEWSKENNLIASKLFIDLGSPSVIKTTLNKNDGVLKLEDIFAESVKLSHEKMEKVEKARAAVSKLTFERRQNFSMSIPFGWEELQFA